MVGISRATVDVDAFAVTEAAPELETGLSGTPRVSVVIPAFNAAATLDETLESLAAQSIDDWEAVVVDDGSTDATARVAEVWSKKDPRVRLLSQPNGGVSRARNAGIELARGEWLFFLDADDWLHPQALGHFLQAVGERSDAGLAYGSLTRVAPDGACDPLFCHERLAADPAATLRHQNHIAVHVLVRRDLVREFGGFDANLKTNEDWDLWRKLAWKGVGFVRAPEAVTYYRMREGSASMDGRQMLRDALEVLKRNPPLPVGAVASHWEDDDFRRTLYALWCAALEAGAGRDPLKVFDGVEARLIDISDHVRDAAECMFDAARVGSRVTMENAAREWRRLSGLLRPMIDYVVRDTGRPELGPRLDYAVEQHALKHHDYGEPLTLSSVHALSLDLREPLPAIDPLPGVETLQVRLSAADGILGTLRVPLYGPMPPHELAEVLIRFFHRKPYSRMTRTHARPRFWAQALLAAPRAALGAPTPGGLKRAAVDALKRATARAAGPDPFKGRKTSLRRAAEIIAEETQAVHARLGKPARRVGAAARPRPSSARDLVDTATVLMYHRVAEEGPADLDRYRLSAKDFEAQLSWLRDNGWRTITSQELLQGLLGQGFAPRSVLLSFDDAYRDFKDAAWPLLKRYGFGAEVFVPTDKVGATSDWDARYGTPAPLMTWDEIEALAEEGVVFGSHLATHARPDSMTCEALLREAARSRAALEARLGTEVRVIATPHGAWDERIAQTLALAGYDTIYTTEPGTVRVGARPTRLNRIEVRGDLGLEAFVASLTP